MIQGLFSKGSNPREIMPIDVDGISKSLRSFVKSHQAEFQKLTRRQSQLLEVGAFLTAAKHYELAGYDVKLINPKRGKLRVKLGTNGYPWNFSRFEVTGDGAHLEIHTNLPVSDAIGTPGARYVVDLAVVKAWTVPREASAPTDEKFKALANEHLLTFIEAKALVIYPMLIAQFIGIVHELKPAFLNDEVPDAFEEQQHFRPCLVSLGYLHGTCWNIVKGFSGRGIHIVIVSKFDQKLSRLGNGGDRSPLGIQNYEDEELGGKPEIQIFGPRPRIASGSSTAL
jgi:hypothetical protein